MKLPKNRKLKELVKKVEKIFFIRKKHKIEEKAKR